jgi:cytochrome c biogenesis protein CcmG, thiol:disulfide interchange protein DsbE
MKLLVLGCMMLLVLACAGEPSAEISVPEIEPQVGEGEVRIGEPAPHFRIQARDGTILDLREMEGKAVVLNFWATWCAPCKVEMPDLEAAYRSHRDDGLEIIGVEIQASGTPEQSVAFLSETGVSFPTFKDETAAMERVYIRRPAWPTSIFIDREGIVHFVQIGPMDRAFIEQQLDDLGF